MKITINAKGEVRLNVQKREVVLLRNANLLALQLSHVTSGADVESELGFLHKTAEGASVALSALLVALAPDDAKEKEPVLDTDLHPGVNPLD